MMKITNLLANTDFDTFISWFSESIVKLYLDTTVKTAESIAYTHQQGTDYGGYFTKKKTIWKAAGTNNEPLAFTVVTEKRGGSIKFGPTIVEPSLRNKGIGASVRLFLEDVYSRLGYRKAYSTTHINNFPAIQYLLKIGYKIELHLKKQYADDMDELVFAKMLKTYKLPRKNTRHHSAAPSFIIEYMDKYYDEIDASFFQSIERSRANEDIIDEVFFINKKKIIHINTETRQFAVIVPKRGGAVKISPLILSGEKMQDDALFESVLQEIKDKRLRKAYTFIPIERIRDINYLKGKNFETEGIISKPYKEDVDLIVLSKLF